MIVEVIRGLNMGGAETLLYTRLRHALEKHPDGFERTVVVNTLRQNDYYTRKLRDLGIEVVELASSNPVRGMRELSAAIDGQGPVSAVVFHSPVTTYFEKSRRAVGRRREGTRLIDVVHSTRYRGPYRVLGSVLDRFSDLAIAVGSDVARSSTTQHYKAVKTVLAGVDLERMRAWITANPDAPARMRQERGIPAEHRLVVAVGSLIPLKGHRFAIEALSAPELSDVSLALVGEGAEREELQRQATALGLESRVHFVGRVDDAWRWTAVADALVHPSHFEGLPVAVMEAAALGTPIVATDVGGLRQIVDEPSVGRLIDSPDTVLLRRALVEELRDVTSGAADFPQRASRESFWSMDRFATDFYSAVRTVAV